MTWDEAAVRYGYTAPILQRNYRRWARWSRLMLISAGASLLIFWHRLWLADVSGALASLASCLVLLALTLRPAHRCWMIRHRVLGRAWYFLTHPTQWWPPALPADY